MDQERLLRTPSFAPPTPSSFPFLLQALGGDIHRNQQCVSFWPPEGRSFSWTSEMNLGWGKGISSLLTSSFSSLTSSCVPSSTSSSKAGCLSGAGMWHGKGSWSPVNFLQLYTVITCHLRYFLCHHLVASVWRSISLVDLANSSAQDTVAESWKSSVSGPTSTSFHNPWGLCAPASLDICCLSLVSGSCGDSGLCPP